MPTAARIRPTFFEQLLTGILDMQVALNRVVSIDYQLRDEAGELIDASEPGAPLEYLHGVGGIVPGLERALEGRRVGEAFAVVVPPADGYGEHNPKLTQRVSRRDFGQDQELELGMRFRVKTNLGPQIVTIIDIEGDVVTLDANHELAGITLCFQITVRDIREATPEEISHGHVHGPGHSH
jgi:FKBP-type peptidyl-prolyl cis-trans isomerase SlyD